MILGYSFIRHFGGGFIDGSVERIWIANIFPEVLFATMSITRSP